METPHPNAVVLDTKGLRALAHPVRVQLIGLLRKHGPATATQLALRLDLNSGATSYHLRQLHAVGFVEELSERGNGRERWWQAAHEETWLDSAEMLQHDPEATLAYLRGVTATNALQVQRALNAFTTMSHTWRDVSDLSDFPLRLTPGETASLRAELREVIARYRKDTPEQAAEAPADAERVELITYLLPDPEEDTDAS
ncbi:ArsR/SmtB family transcription factor [Streptomyces iconiensis]|uniref:Winged helix-turn-helix domain-containing protein n=1 Tax=Streptomyces iconiensis TaxID=1384038 RepID=A0ABT7AAB9_9ACTN|nr:winged helix-turn-helix domain-containing protein [Streptomyces iconiensis]MDJ1137548.1 winged helix-turn-helix domain-containing protein [Streptomyces iconiensis]